MKQNYYGPDDFPDDGSDDDGTGLWPTVDPDQLVIQRLSAMASG